MPVAPQTFAVSTLLRFSLLVVLNVVWLLCVFVCLYSFLRRTPAGDADDVIDRRARALRENVAVFLIDVAPQHQLVGRRDAAADRAARKDLGHHRLHAAHAAVLRNFVVRVVLVRIRVAVAWWKQVCVRVRVCFR